MRDLNPSRRTFLQKYQFVDKMSVKSTTSLSTLKLTNQRTAKRVLKKYNKVRANKSGNGNTTANSYWRLKKLVPTIKSKENISKLDVVLEAISYIQSLQGNLEASLNSRQFY